MMHLSSPTQEAVPGGVLDGRSARDISQWSEKKRALLARRLKGRELAPDGAADAPTALLTEPSKWFEPYPLRAFQRERLACSGPAGEGWRLFLETRRQTLDLEKFRAAWKRLHAHYEVMRSRVIDAHHVVLPPDSPYDIETQDLRAWPEAQRQAHVQAQRQRWHALGRDHGGHAVQVAVCQVADDDFHCFFSFDLAVMDLPSTEFLALRCRRAYEDRFDEDPRPRLSIRDYRVTEDAFLDSIDGARARSYWERKCARQPDRIRAADLTGRASAAPNSGPAYLCETLSAPRWARFQELAQASGLNEFAAVHTLFMDLLARQGGKQAFGMEARAFQRLPLHPHIHELLGPFTLGPVIQREPAHGSSFLERCALTRAQSERDLLHAHFDAASPWQLAQACDQRGQKIVFTNTCVRFDEFVRNSLVPPLRWLGEFQDVWQTQPDTALEYVLVENDLALESHWFINPAWLPMDLATRLYRSHVAALTALCDDPQLWRAPCVFGALETASKGLAR